MLDSLRRGVGTWFVKIFLFVLIASFAVWGIGDIFRGRTDTTLISVGDVKIPPQQFTDAFNREMRRMSQALGQQLTRDQALAFGLLDRTLQQTVTQALYDIEASELGLIARREVILRQIRENPAFQNEFGQFDPFRFEYLLRENGFTEASFIAANQRDLTRGQLFDAVTSGAQAPQALVELFYRRQQERRIAEVLTVPESAFQDVGEPDQAALERFHAERATQFTAPEYRAVTFVMLTPEDLLDEVRVSEADLADEYEDRLSELSTPERRQVEQILVNDEATAQEAVDRLRAGEDFYQVAQALAGQDRSAVRLGEQQRDDLLPEAEEAVFALAQNEISAPVQTAFGWHVFRVTAIASGRKPSFEEARPQLEERLKLRRASDAMFDMANRIDDALAGGSSLEEIAQLFKLRYVKLGSVDPEGRNARGEPVESLPPSREFLRSVFATERGVEPQLREFEDGGYFVLRVDEVTPPALRPLNEVRDAVAEAWRSERRNALAAERATALAQQGRDGELEGLARQAGFAFTRTEPLTRQDVMGQPELSFDAAQALFALQPGETATAANRDGDGRLVLKLLEVKAADPAADPAGVARMRDQLRASVADDLLAGFREALERQVTVRVNERALQAMFEPGS